MLKQGSLLYTSGAHDIRRADDPNELDEVEKKKVRKRLFEVEKTRDRFVAHGDTVVLFHPETRTYLQANALAQRARARRR